MKNPFSFFLNSRGLSDSTVHLGGDNQPRKQQQTNATVPTPQALVPAGYPSGGTGGGHGYNNYTPAVQPPTAYPYHATQPEKEAEEGWDMNAGNNKNTKGQQKTGHIKFGNATNGAGLPVKLPEKGRLVFNVGGNTNEGDSQESGNIEFANIQA